MFVARENLSLNNGYIQDELTTDDSTEDEVVGDWRSAKKDETMPEPDPDSDNDSPPDAGPPLVDPMEFIVLVPDPLNANTKIITLKPEGMHLISHCKWYQSGKLGKIAYMPNSVQVQCSHWGHGSKCSKWCNSKDVPCESALIDWLLCGHAHGGSVDHKAAWDASMQRFRR